ncbi:MAG: hypothetical protein K2M91_10685, partial [Lachnospiraceae bacterium]|nr:hypothetical protein [Lachnospiraceae bacterium]
VELLNEEGKVISSSDNFTMDENNKKIEISLSGEGRPHGIKVYYKNENGEWKLMGEKDVI